MTGMRPIAILLPLLILLSYLAPATRGQELDRNIYIETILDAPVPQVWDSFTTKEGLESFFAPECHIDLRVDGLLDIFFYPD
ncbi:MAG: hypothetical protein R3224_08530, partial [Balneolaceae bacterium]|nr:hypothetical protein [Balneolaceae bacterium]